MIADTRELRSPNLQDTRNGAFLAVRGVTAAVSVDGPLARTAITVTFHNDRERTLEGDLVFPLPPSAALRELRVVVGTRTLRGKIRPRRRAQAEYTRAVQAGHTAALGETEGEDLARLRIAPIAKDEDVEVTLVLLHPLVPTDSGYRLLVPLTYMPRYVEPGSTPTDIERAAGDRPRPLTLAARGNVTVRVRHPSGGTAPTLRCASHSSQTETVPGETVITVGPVPLDRDLHLEIQDRPVGAEPVLWIRHDAGDGPDGLGPTTAVAIVPPAFADEGPAVPRTVTFLVDRSGSMAGGPMASAIRAVRGSLRALGPDDRFNVIAFDTVLEALAPRPVPFDDETLRAADAFISGIDARGGTNATMAVLAALEDARRDVTSFPLLTAPPLDAGHRLRVVVFMTDGDVGSAESVLATQREKLVDTRIHVVGIGHAVNHGMLAALATAGGGTYLPVATDEDLERALARLKNAIHAPLWTGVQVALDRDGERRSPRLLEPPGPLDLFAREPLLLAFRGKLEPGDRLVLDGQRPGGDDRRILARMEPTETDAEAAPSLWALLRNRRLTYRFDPADDATLEALGTTFGLTNHQVALVGVHDEQRDVTVEGSLPVSLPMPGNVADTGHVQGKPPPPTGRMATAMAPSVYAPSAPPGFGPPAPMAPPRAQSGGYAGGGYDGGGAYGGGGTKGGYGAPPPPIARRPAAPMAAASSRAASPPPAPSLAPLTDSEAGLRTLMLSQGADGLFAGEVGTTLAAVAALVTRGHTHREGLFRSELRRTVGTLRQKLGALSGEAQVLAALALALLTVPAGEAPPAELPADLAIAIAGLSTADLPAARSTVRAALAAAPPSWRATAPAQEIERVFQVG